VTKFKSYTDIENSYNNKFITQIREQGFDDANIEWVAEVKIDGSNFQCSIDCEDKFIVGTRTRFLERGADFQGYERAMENGNVEYAIRSMKTYIAKTVDIAGLDPKNFTLRVYGELCGGMYRHPEVEKVKGAIKIQGRVNYHPDNVWIPFDIEIVNANDQIIYVFPQLEAKALCNKFNLPFPIIVKTGSFDELINLPNDFNDETGYVLFGLPKIENNITEGLVIKPNVPLRFGNGSRVMVKSKNDKFKERVHKEPKTPKEIIPMNELEKKYFEIYREFITESRIMSVISKIGTFNNKAFGVILGMFVKDVYKDFDKEYDEEIKALESSLPVSEFNHAKIKKELSKEITDFIRPFFLNHISN
jgi:Rnl2 family RNA ligase